MWHYFEHLKEGYADGSRRELNPESPELESVDSVPKWKNQEVSSIRAVFINMAKKWLKEWKQLSSGSGNQGWGCLGWETVAFLKFRSL